MCGRLPFGKGCFAVCANPERFRLLIRPALPEHSPGKARHLVGQRHGRDLGGFAGNQICEPRQVRRATPLGMADDL